jgi:YHS domain-containing protein
MKYLIPLILAILVIRYLLKKKRARPVAMRPEAEVLKQDPVCGAYVREQPDLSLRTGTGPVYFCGRECMNKFKERTPSN